MTEYKPGQYLTLEFPDGTGAFTLVVPRHPDAIISLIDREASAGPTVTHVNGEPVHETPTLPTEPGAYQAERGRQVFLLNREGDWFDADGTPSFGHGNSPEDYRTLTRLVTLDEARPIIAAEVVAVLKKDGAFATAGWIREEFGVSE